MSNVIEYSVVQAANHVEELGVAVQAAIDDAWQPVGSLQVEVGFGSNGQPRSYHYFQSLVRYLE